MKYQNNNLREGTPDPQKKILKWRTIKKNVWKVHYICMHPLNAENSFCPDSVFVLLSIQRGTAVRLDQVKAYKQKPDQSYLHHLY